MNSDNIPQIDGNDSINSQSDISSVYSDIQCSCCEDDYDQDLENNLQIPVHISQYRQEHHSDQLNPPPWYEKYEPRKIKELESKTNRKVIRRDKKLIEGESLPIISVSNVRSLIPKVGNVKNDILERDISLSIFLEVWEKTNCKKQQFEFEKMFQIDGLRYISTPRLTKRGGGAAIIVNIRKFSLEKIPILIPNNLEVVWGLMRPKKLSSSI